jgi:hypothetical protein
MQCVAFDEFDQVVKSSAESCSFVLVRSDDFLASASLDAASIAYSFTWGFGAVIGLWAMSYMVKAALKSIKMI